MPELVAAQYKAATDKTQFMFLVNHFSGNLLQHLFSFRFRRAAYNKAFCTVLHNIACLIYYFATYALTIV